MFANKYFLCKKRIKNVVFLKKRNVIEISHIYLLLLK